MLKPGSIPDQALSRARQVDVICLSHPVHDELRLVFARPKFLRHVNNDRLAEIFRRTTEAAVWAYPTETGTDCRDPKDNKYLELAWCVSAHCIVSSDADLLTLHPWRGIPIVTPAAYLALRA